MPKEDIFYTLIVDEPKLAAFVRAFGERLLVLSSALLRDTPSDPRVAIMPAYDSWAAGRVTQPPSPHGLGSRPFAQRHDRAIWRGVRSGSECERAGGTRSLRASVVARCAGEAWADVRFGGDWVSH